MWHLASDEAYTFFGVVISRHVREEFVTKCREEGFVTRHFVSTKENIRTQEEELKAADVTEKKQWVSHSQGWHPDITGHPLRQNCPYLARTDFSETLQLLRRLKVLYLFVESALRCVTHELHWTGLITPFGRVC